MDTNVDTILMVAALLDIYFIFKQSIATVTALRRFPCIVIGIHRTKRNLLVWEKW